MNALHQDSLVISLFKKGEDSKAAALVFTAYRPYVMEYFDKYYRLNKSLIEEVFHDSILTLGKRIKNNTYVEKSTIPRFLIGVCKKLLLSHWSRQPKSTLPFIAINNDQKVTELIDDLDAFAKDKEEKMASVFEATRELSKSHREILILIYTGEVSLEEYAKSEQIPYATAKKRLQRARDSLREKICT